MTKKVAKEIKVEYIQILDEEGNADESILPQLSDDELKKMYEVMVYVREFDQKVFNMQRQGRLGTYLQVKGQEATQVGAALGMSDKDFFFPMYRDSGTLVARKHSPKQILQYWNGDERGLACTEEVKNFPITIPVGTQNPLAVGAAWAAKILKKEQAVLVSLGDGATSKGDFHEAANFAGVYQTPCVFLVQNNQFAISTPVSHQTHAQTIAQKAFAYGFTGIQVDGNDILAMYTTVKKAMDDARSGKGPMLVEALTYRMGDHSTSDDAKRYRPDEEIKDWEKKDPLVRYEKFLEKKGIWNKEYGEKLKTHVLEMIEKEIESFEKIEDPPMEDMFTYVFQEMTAPQKEQLEDLKK